MTASASFAPASRSLAVWLFACCALIIAMIVIGAITRLTESGLSMVEWRAMIDMLPPLSTDAWQSEFAKYQLTPEYIKINKGMSLDEFKNIYFWEWLHRLLGRVIGLAYALPLAVFWLRGKIPAGLKPRFIMLLALGGLQGFFGWYMVKSGLVNEPRVSHFRLALHLSTALLLLTLLWLQALALWPRSARAWRDYYTPLHRRLLPHGWSALGMACLTILYGAFVAGLDAGLIYNEFPTMGGKLIPGEWLFETPWWRNFLYNHATVQWTHRVLATLVLLKLLSLGARCIRTRNTLLARLGWGLCAVITLQYALGIVTLLTGVKLHPAVSHQFGATLTLLLLATLLGALRGPKSR